MLSGITAAAASAGYMAGKKQADNKNTYRKILHKLEDMLE
jgi:hypothetical protein